jgi:hypothetical protein
MVELSTSSQTRDQQQAQRLRRLQKADALNQLFDKLKRLRVTKEKSGVTRLEIPTSPDSDPKQCTSWRQIDVPTDVLNHLRIQNRTHFGQAHGTPFTVPPLSSRDKTNQQKKF